MPTMVIRDASHIEALGRRLSGRKLPLTVTWVQGAARSDLQNRLAQRWFTDISRQLGDQTHGEIRAFCKLHFGIPILRRDSEGMDLSFSASLDHLTHEQKLVVIERLEIPVTRLMSLTQMTEFMDAMQHAWARQGIRLTDPEALKYEEEFA